MTASSRSVSWFGWTDRRANLAAAVAGRQACHRYSNEPRLLDGVLADLIGVARGVCADERDPVVHRQRAERGMRSGDRAECEAVARDDHRHEIAASRHEVVPDAHRI